MNCEDCQERLIDHVHHELDDEQRRSVAAHLGSCGDCARDYCRLEADLAGIAPAHADVPRPEVRAALRERVERRFTRPLLVRLFAPLARPIPAYGLVIALFVGLAPALWFALDPGDVGPRRTSDEPRLLDYDATRTPLVHDDVL